MATTLTLSDETATLQAALAILGKARIVAFAEPGADLAWRKLQSASRHLEAQLRERV